MVGKLGDLEEVLRATRTCDALEQPHQRRHASNIGLLDMISISATIVVLIILLLSWEARGS